MPIQHPAPRQNTSAGMTLPLRSGDAVKWHRVVPPTCHEREPSGVEIICTKHRKVIAYKVFG